MHFCISKQTNKIDMNKLIISLLLIIGTIMESNSQTEASGMLTPDIIKKIQSSFKDDGYMKAVSNAVKNKNINELTYTHNNDLKFDDYFKYKVNVTGITNQHRSGRCWMFASLNVLRPIVIEKLNLNEFEFSTNYLFFWDQFEKANLFLEAIIRTKNLKDDDRTIDWLYSNAIGDGGVWNLLVDLVDKYGVVPKQVMPETNSSDNTSQMSRLIREKLREDGFNLRQQAKSGKKYVDLEKEKVEMLKDIYKMLVINLGEPPTTFEWRYTDKDNNTSDFKTYTPKEFYYQYIGLNLNNYVLFMDDPSREYNKLYEIEYDRDMYEGKNWKYINLPADKIKGFMLKSLENNRAMYFSCDVGKQLNRDKGILALDNYNYEDLLNVKFDMDKKARIITHQSGSSHGMSIVGADTDKDNNISKWLIENSWGSESGHNGYLIMTDEWFDQYMFRVVIDKKFIDTEILKILEQKPITLPPWDPMFEADE